ncbi:hypothetical protein ACW0S4_09715 [Fusobacterium polymorphum]
MGGSGNGSSIPHTNPKPPNPKISTEMKEHIEDLLSEKSAAESVEEVIVEAE